MAGVLTRADSAPADTVPAGTASADSARHQDQVLRFWDPATQRWTAEILPGQCYVTGDDEGIVTVLGCCFVACVRDASLGIGGMNHFLPYGSSDTCALECLVDVLLERGATHERLEVRVFGDSCVAPSAAGHAAAIAILRRYARAAGLHAAFEDLGDGRPRHLAYFPATGQVLLTKLHSLLDRDKLEDEDRQVTELRWRPGATASD